MEEVEIVEVVERVEGVVPDGKGTNTVPNTFPCLLNHVNNLIASIEKTAERKKNRSDSTFSKKNNE